MTDDKKRKSSLTRIFRTPNRHSFERFDSYWGDNWRFFNANDCVVRWRLWMNRHYSKKWKVGSKCGYKQAKIVVFNIHHHISPHIPPTHNPSFDEGTCPLSTRKAFKLHRVIGCEWNVPFHSLGQWLSPCYVGFPLRCSISSLFCARIWCLWKTFQTIHQPIGSVKLRIAYSLIGETISFTHSDQKHVFPVLGLLTYPHL